MPLVFQLVEGSRIDVDQRSRAGSSDVIRDAPDYLINRVPSFRLRHHVTVNCKSLLWYDLAIIIVIIMTNNSSYCMSSYENVEWHLLWCDAWYSDSLESQYHSRSDVISDIVTAWNHSITFVVMWCVIQWQPGITVSHLLWCDAWYSDSLESQYHSRSDVISDIVTAWNHSITFVVMWCVIQWQPEITVSHLLWCDQWYSDSLESQYHSRCDVISDIVIAWNHSITFVVMWSVIQWQPGITVSQSLWCDQCYSDSLEECFCILRCRLLVSWSIARVNDWLLSSHWDDEDSGSGNDSGPIFQWRVHHSAIPWHYPINSLFYRCSYESQMLNVNAYSKADPCFVDRGGGGGAKFFLVIYEPWPETPSSDIKLLKA